MAPGRDKRPEGLGLPGMSDAVSGEEIRQRINTLYDRAETDSGTYNATRAMSVGDRRPGRAGRPAQRKPSDPALDAVARKWFDDARSKIGPTVAAVLPADRMPALPGAARPASAPVPELPAAIPAPRPELEAPARRVPELTAGPVAALPAAPAPAPESRPDAFPALPAASAPSAPSAPFALSAGPLAAAPVPSPAPSPVPAPAPAATPVADTAARQTARRSVKGRNQEKLTQARRLLTRQVALRSAPPAPESAPAAAPRWPAPEQDPLFGEGTGWLTQPSPGPDPLAGGGEYPGASGATGQYGTVPSVAGYPNTPIATGQFSLPLDVAVTNPPADTGQFSAIPSVAAYPNTPVDTGQFSLPLDAGLTNPPADTGQFSAVPNMGAVYPSAPAAPGYPSAPASPAYPSAPANVGYPSGPAETAYPSGPMNAAYPSAPVNAAYPSAPAGAAYPSAPAGAAYPATPADTGRFAPLDTGQFAVPAVPAMPPVPPAPAAPVMPTMPAMPAMPAPVGAPEPAGYGGKAANALEFARAQIGRPCLWGATGPESYDCASLTQAAWRAAGVELPRAAADQARAVSAIPLTDLQPGDLIFFHGDTSHVGVCAGPGTMIHAPGPGALIREESIFFAGQAAIHSAARPA